MGKIGDYKYWHRIGFSGLADSPLRARGFPMSIYCTQRKILRKTLKGLPIRGVAGLLAYLQNTGICTANWEEMIEE